MNLGGLPLESMRLEQRIAQFDLSLTMVEAGNELSASLEYNTDLFDTATIKRMLGHFHTLLAAVAARPSQRLIVYRCSMTVSDTCCSTSGAAQLWTTQSPKLSRFCPPTFRAARGAASGKHRGCF